MNLTELYQEREARKSRLALANAVVAHGNRSLAIAESGTPQHAIFTTALSIAQKGLAAAEQEMASVNGAIAAMEAVEASASPQPIEAIDERAYEAIRYASVVIGVGYDPDNPEALFAQSARRMDRKPVCAGEVAQILREFADQLEANHSHDRKDH